MADHLGEGENYTSVPNEILEELYKQKLNGSQYALMLAIWRYTFGFHTCERELSAGFLATATGLNIRTVKKELEALELRKIIKIIPNGERVVHTIKINKQINEWLVVNKPLVSKQPLVVNWNQASGQSVQSLVVNRPPNKESINKENKKEIMMTIAEHDFVTELEKIVNYPADRSKDLEMYKELEKRYPLVDLINAVKDWRIHKIGDPLKPKQNARSQLNTWCHNAQKWGKNLKTNKVVDMNVSRFKRDDYTG